MRGRGTRTDDVRRHAGRAGPAQGSGREASARGRGPDGSAGTGFRGRRGADAAVRGRAAGADAARARGAPASAACAALVAALLLVAPPLEGQQGGDGGGSPVDWGGLLRTGLRVGPEDVGRTDGFELYDARLSASGDVGLIFNFFAQGEFDDRTDEFRLLDARLSASLGAFVPGLELGVGQFKAPFGKEALLDKGEITLVERAQITQVVAPGRQVGLQLSGETLDERLSYRGGIFNGNGRELDNDNDDFLYAAHVGYSNLGTARFYDELVVEVGASIAYSQDSSAPLAGLADVPARDLGMMAGGIDPTGFDGERLLWGVDLETGYRSFFVRGEYVRGEFEPDDPTAPGLEPGDDVTAEGGYVEGGYNLLGAIEGLVRYDAMNDFLGTVQGEPVNEELGEGTDFLVFGLNLFPGRETKLGLQYAVGLDGARRGPGLADDEFAVTAQVAF